MNQVLQAKKNSLSTTATRRRLRGLEMRLLLVAGGLISSFFITTSMAVFSDTDTVSDSRFRSGTLNLQLDKTTALFNATGLKPGDVVYAPLTVSNTGDLDLAFTMTTTASNADNKNLAAALTAEVRDAPGGTCGSSTFSSGTGLAAQVTGIANLANSTPRSLAKGASFVACFKVALPLTADNALQGSETNVNFTFNSSQT